MNIQGNAEFAKQKVVEHPQRDPSTGFDYRTHVKDAKTGKIIRLQHYAKHVIGGKVLLERPPGSGNCFHENGESAGRYEFSVEGSEHKCKKLSDRHIEVAPAPANRMEELEQTNDALTKELEQLRAEAKGKTEQKR